MNLSDFLTSDSVRVSYFSLTYLQFTMYTLNKLLATGIKELFV